MIVIVDYEMGNVKSIANMLKKVGAAARISRDPADIEAASRLILPGVGAFDQGMENIERLGLAPLLARRIVEQRVPVLGICLGMQLLTRSSEEGRRAGLGFVPARTVRFRVPIGTPLKVPHMGWNGLAVRKPGPLVEALDAEAEFYFVHSYHVECEEPGDILATTHYGYDFISAFQHANILGTQFHPEKSHRHGMHLLRRFAEMPA